MFLQMFTYMSQTEKKDCQIIWYPAWEKNLVLNCESLKRVILSAQYFSMEVWKDFVAYKDIFYKHTLNMYF